MQTMAFVPGHHCKGLLLDYGDTGLLLLGKWVIEVSIIDTDTSRFLRLLGLWFCVHSLSLGNSRIYVLISFPLALIDNGMLHADTQLPLM